MGRNIIKHGFKSGALPVTREIFKRPLKPIKIDSSIPHGYAENIQHPKGTSRDVKLPKHLTVEERISTMQSNDYNQNKIVDALKKNDTKSSRLANSQLRKSYIIETLKNEELRLSEEEASKRAAEAAKKAKQDELINMDLETKTTRLTLPSVEHMLEGNIMRERTEEEKEALKLRREHNRLNVELSSKENKAIQLLDLYNDAEHFIIDEVKLGEEIEKAFDNLDYYSGTVSEVRSKLSSFHQYEKEYVNIINDLLNYQVFGASNTTKPGLYEVEDHLLGEFDDLMQKAASKQQTSKEDVIKSL